MSDALCYRDIRQDNDKLREQIKQLQHSIGYASVTIAVLRSQVDDLTKEIRRLKAETVTS